MDNDHQLLLQKFKQMNLSDCTFGHKEHVIVAYLLLKEHDFITAAYQYATTIKMMAKNAGAEDKYNTTVTLALLSLIAERIESNHYDDIDTFIINNPDLMARNPLLTYYTETRISSNMARHILLLPDRIKST